MTLFWIVGFLLFRGTIAITVDTEMYGTVTSLTTYPYIVQVETQNDLSVWEPACSASIMTSRFILSAAQCFFREPELKADRIRTRVGTNRLLGLGRIYLVEKIINHPDYCNLTKQNDISLVKLDRPLVSATLIKQATVVEYGTIVPIDLPVELVGWREIESTVRNMTVKTVNNEVCSEHFGFAVSEKFICASELVPGRRVCPFQPGGPVIYKGILIGVTSECDWNFDGNGTQSPLVSTSVAYYTNWIIETVRSNSILQ